MAQSRADGPSVADVQRVAALRVALRAFERETERAARAPFRALAEERRALRDAIKGI